MKKLIPFLMFALIVPQVVFAAWWNPFTWKIFRKAPDNVQVLEEKVRNLEKALEEKQTDQESSESDTFIFEEKSSVDEVIKPEQKKINPKIESKNENPITKDVQVVNQAVTSPSVEAKNYEKLHLDVSSKFSVLRGIVTNEINNLDKSKGFNADINREEYLIDLRKTLNENISTLASMRELNPKPEAKVESLITNYNLIEKQYETSTKNYESDRFEEELNRAKANVISYIKDNKTNLHLISYHVEAARLLYLFDSLFKTKYAADFELRKTQLETVEFANRFLIDQE